LIIVKVRVGREPIVNKPVARQVRRDFPQHGGKAFTQRGTSMNNVGEVRLEERGL
jgi:hypothetical protein